MLGFFGGLLGGFARFLAGLQELALFSARVFRSCFRGPYYQRDIYEQAYIAGVGSMHLALISAFFAGQALGLQFARQLAETGTVTLLGTLMTIAVVRALGPDLIGLVVAARMASGYTAEIGAMKSANQIDALVAFGTDPIKKLVTPRVLAALIMLPILTVINDCVGIIGGNLISTLMVGVPTGYYWRTVWEQIASGGFTLRYIPNDFIQGLVKPFVFGGIISISACYYGLNTTGGTEGVGQATTRTVVLSSISILVVDYFLTQILLALFG